MAFRSEYCLLILVSSSLLFHCKVGPTLMCLIIFSWPLYLLWYCSSVPKAQGAVQTIWWSQAGSGSFSFYLENNVRLLCFFCLAPPVLELEAVCVHAALLLCSGVRSLGECFPLLPKGSSGSCVLSVWLCVSSGWEVWKITARIAASWADVHVYSGLVGTTCPYSLSRLVSVFRDLSCWIMPGHCLQLEIFSCFSPLLFAFGSIPSSIGMWFKCGLSPTLLRCAWLLIWKREMKQESLILHYHGIVNQCTSP